MTRNVATPVRTGNKDVTRPCAYGTAVGDQCAAAGVPLNFKQWGEFAPVGDGFGTNVRRVGKHAAGRLLDGIEHNDYPKVNP